MMGQRIDHSNYEAWLLDRLEGNLTPEQERELDAFLLLHPELAPDDGDLPTLSVDGAVLSTDERNALMRALPPTGSPNEAELEDHLIARLEGDLTSAQLDALSAYLIDHPQHQRAERLYALTKLVPQAMAFAGKRALQRELPPVGLPNAYNIKDFLVARLEGDLNREQEQALDAILATDPVAAKEWSLIRATRIAAGAIGYPDKSSLKKGGRVIAIGATNWTVRLAAAASIAAVIGLGLWFLLQRQPQGPQVAEEVKHEQPSPVPANDTQPDAVEQKQDEGADKESGPASEQERKVNGPRVTPPPSDEPGGTPPAPIEREKPLPMAEQRQVIPEVERLHEVPADVPVPPVPVSHEEPALAQATAPQSTTTVGELLTATLRERVLDRPAEKDRALNGDDAIAAVDKGLKAVGGDRAGLAVNRRTDGRVGFNLRLGRNLAIAQR